MPRRRQGPRPRGHGSLCPVGPDSFSARPFVVSSDLIPESVFGFSVKLPFRDADWFETDAHFLPYFLVTVTHHAVTSTADDGLV